uniref:uncharacterized protein LOC122604341 n=1 Tax=Erigeron canadensis TaxID=72917 RepID=UPI001CB99146|nr:uncharacterized protein LOC122604341 [Erigeron canadensis]
MRKYIADLPTLTAPKPKEILYVYLAASLECVSAVLVAEREKQQIPIYFVSRVLQGAEANYPELEKLTLALVQAAQKSGWVAKWAIELGEHDIEFRVRNAIKGQVLADFISDVHEGENLMTHSVSLEVLGNVKNDVWKLYTDGAASSDGCEAGLMLISPEGKEFTYALRFEFEVTNNEAEYEALLAGLQIARDMKIRNLQVYVDSQLVANQVKGDYKAKQITTKLYLQKVRELMECFSHFEIEHIRRNQNKRADALSKLASLTFGHLGKQVLVEVLKERSIEEKQVSDLVEEENKNWMTPIYEYLVSEILLADKDEARKIRVKAPQYKIQDKKLYKKGFVTPWLRCVGPNQVEMIIREIHEGICGAHAGARSVATKAMRLGYFWPTMHQDSTALLKNCESCQIRANVPRQPKNDMTSVTSAWPFIQWGIDIVGPLPEAQNKKKFLVVAIDYFTKWVEAKPLATTNGDQMKKFVWEHIICRILQAIANSTILHIRLPPPRERAGGGNQQRNNQGNGETLRAKPQGMDRRTTTSPMGQQDNAKAKQRRNPFQSSIRNGGCRPNGIPSLYPQDVNTEGNEDELRIDLDLLEKRQEIIAIREVAFKKKIEGYYNKRVNPTTFKVGDYVLRLNSTSEKEYTGNMGPTWEGPYRVREHLEKEHTSWKRPKELRLTEHGMAQICVNSTVKIPSFFKIYVVRNKNVCKQF